MAGTVLLSVYHKDGIVEFARALHDMGWELLASGGTAKTISDAGIPVRDVASLVGGGAILGHRVVTLSREVHAGLLAQDTPEDRAELERLGVPWIDLVCVDLYPLQAEVNRPGATTKSVVELTDIGGPTILRSAAKGRRIVICKPDQRQGVLDWLRAGEPDRDTFVNQLAAEAEFLVGCYCSTSATFHGAGRYLWVAGQQVAVCRYGENGWQTPAMLYSGKTDDPLAIDRFRLLAGAEPSFNNLVDVERLLQTATHIAAACDLHYKQVPMIAVGVKHGNPCGAAVEFQKSAVQALKKMLDGDPLAIFGGLVMVNFFVDETVAEVLLSHGMETGKRRVLDGIVAPGFSKEAIEMLKRKGDKCRFLENPALNTLSGQSLDRAPRFRYVRGGVLVQPNYAFVLDFAAPEMWRSGDLTADQVADILLAWAVGSTSNSNTITLVKGEKLIGNGVGQQDRVGGADLAVRRALRAGHMTRGAVAYSDSFFPYVDGVAVLANAGVAAVLTSSGSVNDDRIRQFCQENGIVLMMYPDAKGRGFFGH